MKTKTIIAAVMSALCLLGCDKNAEQPYGKSNAVPPVPDPPVSTNLVDIMESIRLMCDSLGKHGETEEFYRLMNDFYRSATKVSDIETVIQIHDALQSSLLAVDFSGLPYKMQSKVARKIENMVKSDGIFDMEHGFVASRDLWMEKEIEVNLKYLEWKRMLIKRLRPKHRLSKKPTPADGEKTYDEWLAWWYMYYDGMNNYEARLRHVEGMFPYWMRGLQRETVERIKKSVEDYLGRPIRTPEQLHEDHRLKRHVEFLEERDPYAAP